MIAFVLPETVMRNILWILIAALAVTACASSKDDSPKPEEYGQGPADPAPDIDIGTWTGSVGNRATSFILADDGSGIMCWSEEPSGKYTINHLRYRNGLLLSEDNTKYSISDASADTMTIEGLEAMAGTYHLRRDTDLTLASPVCGKKLQRMRR